jgi:hypothetical protein
MICRSLVGTLALTALIAVPMTGARAFDERAAAGPALLQPNQELIK